MHSENNSWLRNYQRIEAAINYLQQHTKAQPSLDEVAKHIHLSPTHLQKLFTEWAGVSPKKFLQYLSLAHAKKVLKQSSHTIEDALVDTGLSSSSRLHDLFVNIEGMRPGIYKNGGAQLRISYDFACTPFGRILSASTDIGLCYMAFITDEQEALQQMRTNWPLATYHQAQTNFQLTALAAFYNPASSLQQIKLHLKCSPFQLKVWECLLTIPTGERTTYGNLAARIGMPHAARAVGTAIGSNPIAYLIPCHRVIQATGQIGGYRWGVSRKAALLAWECAQNEKGQ